MASAKTIQKFSHEIEATIEVGSTIRFDEWSVGTVLEASDYPELWEFRVPSASHTNIKYAADMVITGRKAVSIPYYDGMAVRVKAFFHDGEGNVNEASGYMLLK
jgi:hypothetical protein